MITSINEFRKIYEEQRAATDTEIHVMDYLQELREEGTTNMFGAVPYILEEFPELDRAEASRILTLWMKNFNSQGKYNLLNEAIDKTTIAAGLSDSDEIRPLRMKAPDSTYRHDYALFNSRNPRGGGLYIQDQMNDMLIDKYGTERGNKMFDGILDAKGGAFFALGDKIAREKSTMQNELGIHGTGDYFEFSYFSLWKAWMDLHGYKYVIPTAAEIQAKKDEIERIKKEEEEKIRQAKIAQTKADFDRALNALNTTYAQYANLQPDAKDIQRVVDLFNKRNMYNDVPKMVNSIKDKNKAARRGNAIVKYLIDNNKFDRYDLSYAEQFFKKANQL